MGYSEVKPTTVKQLREALRQLPPDMEVVDAWDEMPLGVEVSTWGGALVLWTYGRKPERYGDEAEPEFKLNLP